MNPRTAEMGNFAADAAASVGGANAASAPVKPELNNAVPANIDLENSRREIISILQSSN
jgi:hypothetical protein